MSDTLNALIDFLANPEQNGPADLRARVAGMNENERRDALARAAREAQEMDEAVARERHDAQRRETRRLEAARPSDAQFRREALREGVSQAGQAFLHGSAVGPWLQAMAENPSEALGDAARFTWHLARPAILDPEPTPRPGPTLERFAREDRAAADTNPAARGLGSMGTGYLMAALAGTSQALMASRGFIPSLLRTGYNSAMAAGIGGAQAAVANPDMPNAGPEEAKQILSSPITWALSGAAETVPALVERARSYLASRAAANANQAARLRLDALGVSGGQQEQLRFDAEPRGAAEFQAANGMSPEEFARRGAEAGGVGRQVRDIETTLKNAGVSVTDQGDVIGDALARRREALGARLGELFGQNSEIDTVRTVQRLRDEAARLRAERTLGGQATATQLEDLANRLSQVNQGTQEVWGPTGEIVTPETPASMRGGPRALPADADGALMLPSAGGATPRAPQPEIVMGPTTENVTLPMSMNQVVANRGFIDEMQRFERVPLQGGEEARRIARDMLNDELDQALLRLDPAVQAEVRAASREYSVIGPSQAPDGLETIVRNRAASQPGIHLESAAAAGLSGNAGAMGARLLGGHIFEGGKIANFRADMNRSLSDMGRAAAANPTVERMGAEAPTLFGAAGRLHLGGPGGQPATPTEQPPSPLQTAPHEDDDMRGFRPVASSPDPIAPPPSSGTPPLDDDDRRGFRPLY